jgi:hypothetical protein
MDIGTTITILVVILICIIPFAVMSFNNSKRKKRLLQSLNKLAAQHNSKINEHDFWSNSIIGLSDNGNYVFAIRNIKGNMVTYNANLLEMQKCRVLNSSRTVKNNGSDFVITDKLALAFSNRSKDKADIVLDFYNTDYDSLTLTEELQLTEKWCKILNNKIASSI